MEREENDARGPEKITKPRRGLSTIAGGCRVLFSRLPAVSRDQNPDDDLLPLALARDPISARLWNKLGIDLHWEGGEEGKATRAMPLYMP